MMREEVATGGESSNLIFYSLVSSLGAIFDTETARIFMFGFAARSSAVALTKLITFFEIVIFF